MRLGNSAKRLDATAIQQGVVKECPYRDGLTVRVLPAAGFNPRFRKAIQNQAVQALSDSAESAREAFINRYEDPAFVAKALVADMDPIYDDDGERLDYTPEIGEEVLSDPGNADVLQWIVNEALTYGQFYTDTVEAEAKN